MASGPGSTPRGAWVGSHHQRADRALCRRRATDLRAAPLAGALLLRVDVALPVLAAAVVIALATVALQVGR